jgi:hypothetical protein
LAGKQAKTNNCKLFRVANQIIKGIQKTNMQENQNPKGENSPTTHPQNNQFFGKKQQ